MKFCYVQIVRSSLILRNTNSAMGVLKRLRKFLTCVKRKVNRLKLCSVKEVVISLDVAGYEKSLGKILPSWRMTYFDSFFVNKSQNG